MCKLNLDHRVEVYPKLTLEKKKKTTNNNNKNKKIQRKFTILVLKESYLTHAPRGKFIGLHRIIDIRDTKPSVQNLT